MRTGRPWTPAWGLAAGALALLLAAGAGLALDLDRDGDRAWTELRAGTSPWAGDSDGDLLEDGWERRQGLDALRRDTEDDGVPDDRELRLGADPLSGDSDGDALADRDEAALPDCDGDGLGAIAEGDGDADGRLDALEAAPDRCARDADGDGLADGHEGNARCIHNRDCDADGLPDGNETAGFDPLDPDSFGSGVADGVSFAFQRSGQAAGGDADDDGIPDGWEGDDGLIVWGDLRPVPGERDLLVEFLRVQGPHSGLPRYAGETFQPAYTFVADALRAERGVRLRWTETVVPIAQETDPALVPTLDDPYYASVLAQGRHSANPYVTTVVLNPQHDQSQLLHAGVAPIRGMLAAVDYGAHVAVHFANGTGARVLTMQPIVESMVRGGRQDLLAEMGYEGGYTQAGEMGLRELADGDLVIWRPSWFQSPPRIVQGTRTTQLSVQGVTVFHGSLAGTIMHELGHTLGLCHAHESDCNARFSAADRAAQDESIMSYDNPGNLLHYLPSEWTTVLQYVSCPPDAPVRLVAAGASREQLLDSKYGYANEDVLHVDLRTCKDFTPWPRQFVPGVPPAATYIQPAALARPADDPQGPAWTAGFAALAVVAVAAAAAAGARWGPVRRARPADAPPAAPATPGGPVDGAGAAQADPDGVNGDGQPPASAGEAAPGPGAEAEAPGAPGLPDGESGRA